MMHIGGSYSPLSKLLALLQKGDVVTHCYNHFPPDILDTKDKVKEFVIEARRRGVRFDVKHGAGSFSFNVTAKCLGQGFPPDTISTDLYTADAHGPVYDMATTVSKFMLLGMPLPDIIRRTTVNAVETFHFQEQIGTLKPGAEAEVSVFEIQQGNITFTDSYRNTRQGRQKLMPVNNCPWRKAVLSLRVVTAGRRRARGGVLRLKRKTRLHSASYFDCNGDSQFAAEPYSLANSSGLAAKSTIVFGTRRLWKMSEGLN
jgi:predicted amidohydrolase